MTTSLVRERDRLLIQNETNLEHLIEANRLRRELLDAVKRIVASAPLKGLPLALELDIQHAANLISRVN